MKRSIAKVELKAKANADSAKDGIILFRAVFKINDNPALNDAEVVYTVKYCDLKRDLADAFEIKQNHIVTDVDDFKAIGNLISRAEDCSNRFWEMVRLCKGRSYNELIEMLCFTFEEELVGYELDYHSIDNSVEVVSAA